MKRSTKAALMSGLLFPGIGHLYLKAYWRGWILVLAALVAGYVIIRIAVQQAMTVMDRISSGEVPMDPVVVAELVSKTSNAADDMTVNVCGLVVGACWLFGIFDSYRTGRLQDAQNRP